jgi:hypothetical protein
MRKVGIDHHLSKHSQLIDVLDSCHCKNSLKIVPFLDFECKVITYARITRRRFEIPLIEKAYSGRITKAGFDFDGWAFPLGLSPLIASSPLPFVLALLAGPED